MHVPVTNVHVFDHHHTGKRLEDAFGFVRRGRGNDVDRIMSESNKYQCCYGAGAARHIGDMQSRGTLARGESEFFRREAMRWIPQKISSVGHWQKILTHNSFFFLRRIRTMVVFSHHDLPCAQIFDWKLHAAI